MKDSGKRYIGLDMHKHYLMAVDVDDDLNVVLSVCRVEFSYLEAWMKKTLTQQDEVVLEMTTNTWQLYDELCAYAGVCLCRFGAGGPPTACCSHYAVSSDE